MRTPIFELAFHNLTERAAYECARYGALRGVTEARIVTLTSLYREWEKFEGVWQTVANVTAPAAFIEAALASPQLCASRRVEVPSGLSAMVAAGA